MRKSNKSLTIDEIVILKAKINGYGKAARFSSETGLTYQTIWRIAKLGYGSNESIEKIKSKLEPSFTGL